MPFSSRTSHPPSGQVWWPEDKQYYTGVLNAYDAVSGKHRVLYDDGEWEFLDLSAEPTLVDLREPLQKEKEKAGASRGKGGASAAAGKEGKDDGKAVKVKVKEEKNAAASSSSS